MLEKTAEMLERRLESKPLHHIDTSIIVESEKTIDGRFCRRYIQKLNYNYRGVFSSPVMGELLLTMIRFKEDTKRHTFLDVVSDIIYVRQIEFYTPINIHDVAARIKEIDTRLDPTDVDIVACAIENKADNLVTLDRNLIGNKAIEAEFRLRITHPKDLVYNRLL